MAKCSGWLATSGNTTIAGWLVEIETQSQHGDVILPSTALQDFSQPILRKIRKYKLDIL